MIYYNIENHGSENQEEDKEEWHERDYQFVGFIDMNPDKISSDIFIDYMDEQMKF